MHGSRRHRDQEARTKQLYKCTLYLFIVFSLELSCSATGEQKKVPFRFLDGPKSEPTFCMLCLIRI